MTILWELKPGPEVDLVSAFVPLWRPTDKASIDRETLNKPFIKPLRFWRHTKQSWNVNKSIQIF